MMAAEAGAGVMRAKLCFVGQRMHVLSPQTTRQATDLVPRRVQTHAHGGHGKRVRRAMHRKTELPRLREGKLAVSECENGAHRRSLGGHVAVRGHAQRVKALLPASGPPASDGLDCEAGAEPGGRQLSAWYGC